MISQPQRSQEQAAIDTPEATPAVRFRAPNGSHWKVFELEAGRAGPSLIFSSDDGFRRVRAYPRDWRSLDADALWALSWGR